MVPKGALLEVGFGDDSFIKLCKDTYQAYGVDISPWAVDNIGADYIKDKFKICDISKQKIPFAETFDAIVLINTLEHIEDVTMAMKNMYDAMNENGVLVLFLPTESNYFSRFLYIKYDVPEHVYRPSINDVNKLCSKSGYTRMMEYSGNFIPFDVSNPTIVKSFNLYLGFFRKECRKNTKTDM
jgi:SAM-dependent methyltransferase